MTSPKKSLPADSLERAGRTVGLLHVALRCARKGGMRDEEAAALNERIAELVMENLRLRELRKKPRRSTQLESEREILACAWELLVKERKPERGLAGRIKRRLKLKRLEISERHINRILDQAFAELSRHDDKK
jgi:hypothetical protein